MPIELPREAEDLLLNLARAEGDIERSRTGLKKRSLEIAELLVTEVRALPTAERKAAFARAAEKLNHLRRTTYRSELASLAGATVIAERERAMILRRLEVFAQLGEVAPTLDIAIDYDGERTFVFKTGGGRNFSFEMPLPIYRGLWKAEGSYRRGDMVSADGGLWVARNHAPVCEPGKGAEWAIAAMKGRNGRDLQNLRGK